MTSEHATQHTPSDMSSDVLTEHPLAAAASALGEISYATLMASSPHPSLSLCISAAIEQIGELFTHLDAQTRAANHLFDYLLQARERLTELEKDVLQGEDDAYKARFEINRLAEKVCAANLQREPSQGQERQG